MKQTTVVHCMREEYDVYIGRKNPKIRGFENKDSIWANPFFMKTEADRDMVCEQYKTMLIYSPALLQQLPTLVGKRLGCWCSPKRCHGDVIVGVMRERGLI